MTSRRLEYHYLKLHRRYVGDGVETTLQELAELLSCTRRHVRSLLGQMEVLGWIQWHSRSGRGYRSTLRCLYAPDLLLRQRVEQLLAQGHVEQAVLLMEADPQLLTPLLLKQLGKSQQQEQQILRVPYYRPMPNLNPCLPLRRSEAHLVRQIFNGLTRINEENGEVESDLAHHWQQIDERQWLFYLRPAVRFHDGRLLDTADVLATLKRLQQHPLFCHLQRVWAVNARTIGIELTRADGRLPWLLADVMAMVLPADHGQRTDFASRPVGTGPYRVVENNAYHLRLRAFDDYFALRALLDEVDIWMMPMLADEMRLLLAEQGVTVELLELDYASWQRGEVMADLWLGSVNFAAPGEWSLGCWLLGSPLLRRSICGGDEQQLTLWHQQWQGEQLSSEQLTGQVISLGWLQPLFHHWLRLQGPAQARGIRLNNLGWFDFKSAWLTPTMTPTRSPVS